MIQVYGIANCDQVRAARKWLKAHALPYAFIDLREEPISQALIFEWLKRIPYDSLLNRRGKSWRDLSEERRRAVVDQASALELMLERPLIIKRPVLVWKDQLAVGFSDPLYRGLFGPAESPSSDTPPPAVPSMHSKT